MLTIEFDQEEDGRWIAEVPSLPGVLAYGATRDEAQAKVEIMALRVLADTPGDAKPYTDAEDRAIDAGLADAEAGRFATDEDVEDVFRRLRSR